MRATVSFVFAILLAFAAAGQTQDKVNGLLSFGTPGANVRIEVFYDLECRACPPVHERLRKAVERFPGKISVTIRHFPLRVHANAFMASSVVEVARRQGKGVDMVELVLREQEKWSSARRPFDLFRGYAERLGLNMSTLQTDVLNDDVIRSVLFDIDRGRMMKVNATPFMYLNGKQIPFAEMNELEEVIKKVIESQR